MDTFFFPQHWGSFPLSIGLFMAPWGGHSIYPQVYRDMRHPEKFSRALGVSYSITFAIDMSMGVLGYLMFGKDVFEEVPLIPHPPKLIF
jgi:solute carrier family 32 (vesicular inhibitory amino acid transporter)